MFGVFGNKKVIVVVVLFTLLQRRPELYVSAGQQFVADWKKNDHNKLFKIAQMQSQHRRHATRQRHSELWLGYVDSASHCTASSTMTNFDA